MTRDLESAKLHLATALELLDAAGAPADIGAHVDMALCRIGELLLESSSQQKQARPYRFEILGQAG